MAPEPLPMAWARICKPFKEPRNRFPAWEAGTTTLFVVPAGMQATEAGRIDSSESIPGLHKRLQIRALYSVYTAACLQFIVYTLGLNVFDKSVTLNCVI